MFNGADLDRIYKLLYVFAVIGLTFGLWKIIEIIVWLCKHVSIVLH